MLFVCHRINNSNDLSKVESNYGVELDLRDDNDKIIISHDPFTKGEHFDNYLESFVINHRKNIIILNVKSERIEYRILEMLKKYNINNYFFLDCSFPMIYQLNKIGEKNIAIRYSEFESIENVILAKDMVKWVWVDCFNKFPLTKEHYDIIKSFNLKICLVSPELQGHDIDMISEFKNIINVNNFEIDAICTKSYNIEKWKM